MRWLLLILLIPMVSGAVEIGTVVDDAEGVVIDRETEQTTGVSGNGTFNQTLTDLLYWRLDGGNAPPTANWEMNNWGFFNIGDSNTTGQLTINNGNGRIISTGAAGGLRVNTDSGEPGYISFGNTADIGISSDGIEGTWDSDGTMVFKQKASNPDSIIEFLFYEESGSFRFALPGSGADHATGNPRSLIVGYGASNNESDVLCSHNGYDRIDCDTGATGGDLGVTGDIQTLSNIYVGNYVDTQFLNFSNKTQYVGNFSNQAINFKQIELDLYNDFDSASVTAEGIIDVAYTDNRFVHDAVVDYAQLMRFVYGGNPQSENSNLLPIIFNLNFATPNFKVNDSRGAYPKGIQIDGSIRGDVNSDTNAVLEPTLFNFDVDFDAAGDFESPYTVRYFNTESAIWGTFGGAIGNEDFDVIYSDFRPTVSFDLDNLTYIKYNPSITGNIIGDNYIIDATSGDIKMDDGDISVGGNGEITENLTVGQNLSVGGVIEGDCIEDEDIFVWQENGAPSYGGYMTLSGTLNQFAYAGRYVPHDITLTEFNIKSTQFFDCVEQQPFNFILRVNETDGTLTDIFNMSITTDKFNSTSLDYDIDLGEELMILGTRGSAGACTIGTYSGDDVEFQVVYERRCN